MEYSTYIDQMILETRINQDKELLTWNGDSITVKDFVEKTKQMKPWHRQLLSDFRELQENKGDVCGYMKKYIKEKINAWFDFKNTYEND